MTAVSDSFNDRWKLQTQCVNVIWDFIVRRPFAELKLVLTLLFVHCTVAVQIIEPPAFFLARSHRFDRPSALSVHCAFLLRHDILHWFTTTSSWSTNKPSLHSTRNYAHIIAHTLNIYYNMSYTTNLLLLNPAGLPRSLHQWLHQNHQICSMVKKMTSESVYFWQTGVSNSFLRATSSLWRPSMDQLLNTFI